MTTPSGRTPSRLAAPGRRSFLTGVLGASVLGLAACGGDDDTAAAGSGAAAGPETTEPVVLTVAWWGGPARAENTQKVLDLYTKAHPNVTFKTQWQGYSGYYDKINTSAAGRNAPDIIQIDNRALREYANKKLIAELDPFVGKTLVTDQIDPKLLGTGKVDDKLYALPLASNTQAFAVDATVLGPLNLLPAEAGWADYDEFSTWAASVTKATGGKVWGTRDESANLSWMEPWLRQNGKELYDGQALGFSEAEAVEWFTLWDDLRKSGGASPAEVSQPANSGDISKNTVTSKQTTGSFTYDNQLTELAKATDHELQLVPLPGDLSGNYARPSQFFTAYARGKNIPTAVDVINFFDNDQAAGEALGTERGLPPSKEIRDAISPTFSDQLKYVVAYDERVTAEAGPTPPVPAQGDSQIGQLLTSAAENVAFGRAQIADAAKEFVSQANSALERAGS
ncbi:ABC transporter substrate-binding protein [Kineococcus rubinsiae]|uniref:ABC transporter substrate-binding protein n=1 Tax=Kineococcus rubinsiae TaxID=2609562 RepID=UPI0014304CD9|nr:ABC transporter substrate-binding protein [Kineococcus rubinsiae]NIZ92102.1 carbohydrate ABC transporter substrate-binding protein [Kineococcus rubinsiae]